MRRRGEKQTAEDSSGNMRLKKNGKKSITSNYLVDRGLEGSAAIVGKPVALVTVENVMFERRGFEA
ncbi:unnamed protein product [Gongylonema pulchrum]|uniref:MOSC domain-containing protein n=1 Tax=Gongylonema pulchrum TaxID=637853 RepID=A0A183D1L6_9BILA|nr:unnamed protein product [Gongylonema pulchrum]